VPGAGLEPARPCGQCLLRAPRQPIAPSGLPAAKITRSNTLVAALTVDAPRGAEPVTDAAATADDEPIPLRRNKAFRRLWIGQIVSSLGTSINVLAYPLLILALTHSALIAGAVGTARVGVGFALRLPAGALADRLDRRRTMIGCDVVRTLALTALGVLILVHAANWPVVLGILVIDSAGGVLFDPASTAALPVIVPPQQLEAAWAATEARNYAASLGGPALGGLLFALGRAVPFLSDAFSYAVSVFTVEGLRGRFRAEQRVERRPIWRETIDGVRTVFEHALLRAVILQAPLINFSFSGVIFAITLGMRGSGYSATTIGLVQAGISAGGLFGAIVAPRLQGRLSLSRLVVFVALTATTLFLVAAVVIPSPLVALPVAATFFLAPTANAALFAVMLRSTPDHSRGRVTNTVITAATALSAVAPIVAGVLVEDVDIHWALACFGLAMAVSSIMAMTLRGLRESEEALSPESAPPLPIVE
jgi:MFS family permease